MPATLGMVGFETSHPGLERGDIRFECTDSVIEL